MSAGITPAADCIMLSMTPGGKKLVRATRKTMAGTSARRK